jgi:hypothetical protein
LLVAQVTGTDIEIMEVEAIGIGYFCLEIREMSVCVCVDFERGR